MRTLFLTLSALALTLFLGSAQAEFSMAIDDPETQAIDIVVEDNGQGDMNVLPGIIMYCPPRSDLEACITGYSKDKLGSTAVTPKMSLAIAYIKNWPKSIRVALTDTGFDMGSSTATTIATGLFNSGDSIVVDIYGDTDNRAFEPGFPITTMGPYLSCDGCGDFEEVKDAASEAVGSLTMSVFFETSNNVELDTSVTIDLELKPSSANVNVPDVVGLEESLAIDNLEMAGLQQGTTSTQTSDSTPEGDVISQSPAGNTSAAPGTRVDLVVSSGSEDVQEPVADMNGLAGLWYDPAYDGEGFNMLVTDAGWFMYYYGWAANSQRLWLISEISTESIQYGQSVTLEMQRGISGIWSNPDPGMEAWGEMTIIFDSCDASRAQIDGQDGSKTVNLTKIIGMAGVDCGN
jgi:hypothetical protein